MRILILGAAGRVGRLIVDEALRRGYEVTAFVRSREKLADVAARTRVVVGDALDRASVSAALIDQDAVVFALGAGNVRETTLFSDSTRLLLSEMERAGVTRLVCITGVGAGETKGHGGFLYDRIVFPLFTKRIYADKDKQESLIRQSQTNWTIVRPAPFKRRTPDGPLRSVTAAGVTLRGISPAEVASFVLDELEQNRYIRSAVFIGHP
jgi:putative NADH-flavin reductase